MLAFLLPWFFIVVFIVTTAASPPLAATFSFLELKTLILFVLKVFILGLIIKMLKSDFLMFARQIITKVSYIFNFMNNLLKNHNLRWEGVGTSNFRTSTGQKFQNVEMVFLVDQNVESDLPMAFCLLNLT